MTCAHILSRFVKPLHVTDRGFTLVELLIVTILTVMFSTLVLTFAIGFWGLTASLQNDSETLVTRQNSGDVLRDVLNVSSGLINQNSITDIQSNNSDPADVTGTHWVPLHAIPGAIPLPAAGATTPVFYFSAPSVTTSKTFIMNGVQPFQDEFVFYLDGSSKELRLRTLTNPGASGNKLRTSCPPAAVTPSCPTDRTMAYDVSSVDTRYFSRSGNLLNWTSITDPITGGYIGPDFTSVEVVELTIHLARKSTIKGGTPTQNQTVVRVALRNG